MKTLAAAMSRQQFDQLFAQVSNSGVWGPDDQRGTLNYITPQTVQRAASLVKPPPADLLRNSNSKNVLHC
jgi:hypothetical protein